MPTVKNHEKWQTRLVLMKMIFSIALYLVSFSLSKQTLYRGLYINHNNYTYHILSGCGDGRWLSVKARHWFCIIIHQRKSMKFTATITHICVQLFYTNSLLFINLRMKRSLREQSFFIIAFVEVKLKQIYHRLYDSASRRAGW